MDVSFDCSDVCSICNTYRDQEINKEINKDMGGFHSREDKGLKGTKKKRT